MFYTSWELSSIKTACSEYELRRLNFDIDLNLDSKLEYTATTTKSVKVDLPKQTGESLKKRSGNYSKISLTEKHAIILCTPKQGKKCQYKL